MRRHLQRFLEAALPRRVTTRREYLASVDGLRFVAIAWVVLYHLSGYIIVKTGVRPSNGLEQVVAWLFDKGHWGVELFFVISGFILGLPFAAQHTKGGRTVPLKKYFARRLTRLEPPYIAAMLGAAALAVVIRGDAVARVLPHLGAHLVYLHNLVFDEGSLNVVTWSLEVEVQFYILAPLLAVVFKLPPRWRRGLLIAAMPLFGALGYYLDSIRADKSIFYYVQLFAGGFLLADLHLHAQPHPTQSVRNQTRRDLAGGILFASLPFVFDSKLLGALLAPLIITAFYYCVLQGNVLKRIFSSLVISRIGGMCYSMYLLHYLVISASGRFVVGRVGSSYSLGLILVGMVCLPAILISTIVFFRAIELPCMRPDWPSRLARAVLGKTSKEAASVKSLP